MVGTDLIMDDIPNDQRFIEPYEDVPLKISKAKETLDTCGFDCEEKDRIETLRQEQEELAASLSSLSNHFAHVQLRLKQIMVAPPDQRERLLHDLEQFAFRGIPIFHGMPLLTSPINDENSLIEDHKEKQRRLIEDLRRQLTELEIYACQTGCLDCPSSVTLEKQHVIIEELRNKLNLQLDNLSTLSEEELKKAVDNAIKEIITPVRIKEQLVSQMRTQISDLERFIKFLQVEGSVNGQSADMKVKLNDEKVGLSLTKILKQLISVLHLMTLTMMGRNSGRFESNLLKKTSDVGKHYGDLRAELEIAIENVVRAYQRLSAIQISSLHDYPYEEYEYGETYYSEELVQAIRKHLAPSISALLEHGLTQDYKSRFLSPFGCFHTRRRKNTSSSLTAWDLIMKYYEIKKGYEFNTSPAFRLNESFGLDIFNGRTLTLNESFLAAVGSVLRVYDVSKSRSRNILFKAFVCRALNEKKLVQYLRLLIQCSYIIETFYQPWSYVKSTGFCDALHSLDKLTYYTFNLPMDCVTKRIDSIRELFN